MYSKNRDDNKIQAVLASRKNLKDFFCARLLTGFTLLETIVALAIITAAATGPVVLITRGILSFGFSKNKLIALNLAQEGLELIREVRENNIICDERNGPAPWDWFRDPDGSGIINNRDLEADIMATLPLTGCGSASISSPSLSPSFANTQLRLDPITGIYSYSGPLPTIFTRQITINKPSADGNIPANDQRNIISVVRWTERGIVRDMTLRERLYNWQ